MTRFLSVGCLLLLAARHSGCAEASSRARVWREPGAIVIANRWCLVRLDAARGEIVSVRPGPPTLRGSWFEATEEDRRGLLPHETWKRGKEAVWSGGAARSSVMSARGSALATFSWSRPSGLHYEALVLLRDDDRGPRLRVRIVNRTGAALVDSVRMPRLVGLAVGDPEDDWFTWPHTLGARFRVRGFAHGERLAEAYPDFLTMQWLDLHDEREGVYLGCLDAYGWSKRLFIGRDPAGRSEWGIEFHGCWVARRGDAWTTPWVQIVAHKGGWRSGARLYRRFAEQAFGPLDPLERVADMPTAQCWLAHHARDADVGRLFEVHQQAPVHASYLMKSVNTSTPEGWDGLRGSALDLHAAFRRIRQLGGSTALFTFDRAPLMGRPNYADHARRWVATDRDGRIVEAFRDMMPSPTDPAYRRARIGEAVRWVREFGLDEIHFDTAATTGALGPPSYRRGAAGRPNQSPHAFRSLYLAIRDACRRFRPGFLLRAEHCADYFYPAFLTSTAHFFETAQLVEAHGWPKNAEPLPLLFRATLPRHAALQMPSLSENDFWPFGYGMGHGFHGGGPSWCFNPGVRDPESPPGELLHRYRTYDGEWRRYWDFRVGFREAVVTGQSSDVVASALMDGRWRRCEYPGPLVAVTHTGAGREVTLGQWYPLSRTEHFARRFTRPAPVPRSVLLRVPTRLRAPRVRLYGERGELPVAWRRSGTTIEARISEPSCFALEVYEGPAIRLDTPPLSHPGEPALLRLVVRQDRPVRGHLEVRLPHGWPAVPRRRVPALRRWSAVIVVRPPRGLFGRNYPVKVVWRSARLTRTVAAHLKVMDRATVLYRFRAPDGGDSGSGEALIPGRPGRLTVTCVNNTASAGTFEVSLTGAGASQRQVSAVTGVAASAIGASDAALTAWIERGADPPGNVSEASFDLDGPFPLLQAPTVEVRFLGRLVTRLRADPRTRVMDLSGQWQVQYTPASRATVGGAERWDNLDTEAVTPDVWDGGWQTVSAPHQLSPSERAGKAWAIYRRLVYIPREWQGADLVLRLVRTGAPWGEGGTLNLVYLNGWPCGRIGFSGECPVTEFAAFGGWNLLAVASMSPNSLVDPYLFVRSGKRIAAATAPPRPDVAFLELGARPTGQGITMPFIQGTVDPPGVRRTDVRKGGEHVFLYFAVADEYVREPSAPVDVVVEYRALGAGRMTLDYDSTDDGAPVQGAFKAAPSIDVAPSAAWRTAVVRLRDARLANRQHQGADFRLGAQGADIAFRRVEVRLAR